MDGQITAIVPCSKPAFLDRTIKSLLAQTHKIKDIIVIADGIEIDDYPDSRVLIFRNLKNLGKAESVNRMVDAVDSSKLLMIDADTYLADDALEHMIEYLRGEIKIVIPNLFSANPGGYIGKVHDMMYRRVERSSPRIGIIGCCFLTTKKFLQEHKFPTYSMVEDQALGVQLKKLKPNGVQAFQAKLARCYTEEPHNARELFRQQTRWSFGSIQVLNMMDKTACRIIKWMGRAAIVVIALAIGTSFYAGTFDISISLFTLGLMIITILGTTTAVGAFRDRGALKYNMIKVLSGFYAVGLAAI